MYLFASDINIVPLIDEVKYCVMKFDKKIFFSVLILLFSEVAFAQGNYEKMGTQAFMRSDYKVAIVQLEKADDSNPGNLNVLKMLGYSYFQCADFGNAVEAYSRLIELKVNDYAAYYYRGKARLNLANDPKESANQMRESFYVASIKDFTKAIDLSGEEDVQILQNRGIAYKDYGIFKSYKIKKTEKMACIGLFNNSIVDFQKVLTVQPLRKDIIGLIDYVKAQSASLK